MPYTIQFQQWYKVGPRNEKTSWIVTLHLLLNIDPAICQVMEHRRSKCYDESNPVLTQDGKGNNSQIQKLYNSTTGGPQHQNRSNSVVPVDIVSTSGVILRIYIVGCEAFSIARCYLCDFATHISHADPALFYAWF